MSEVSRVYVTKDVYDDRVRTGEHGRYLSGYVERDATGVTIYDRDDHRGERSFIPMHLVLRVDHGAGW